MLRIALATLGLLAAVVSHRVSPRDVANADFDAEEAPAPRPPMPPSTPTRTAARSWTRAGDSAIESPS